MEGAKVARDGPVDRGRTRQTTRLLAFGTGPVALAPFDEPSFAVLALSVCGPAPIVLSLGFVTWTEEVLDATGTDHLTLRTDGVVAVVTRFKRSVPDHLVAFAAHLAFGTMRRQGFVDAIGAIEIVAFGNTTLQTNVRVLLTI